MFTAGETIIYGAQGICKVEGVTEMTAGREKKSYYMLSPIYTDRSTIYVPMDNEKLLANMRYVLSKQEIDRLIDDANKQETTWIEDDLARREHCAAVIKGGDRMALMQLIEMLYLHRESLKETKKHFHISDERYLREAERLIHDEFSFVLEIPREDVPNYIINRIQK